MKKWVKIGLVIAVFFFLAGRALYIRVSGSNGERLRYVNQLGFLFSASVDSLRRFSRTNGLVYITATQGKFNPAWEDQANQKLEFNGELRFVLDLPNGKRAFHSLELDKYKTGDSLVVNSDVDKIYIYRKGKLIAESEISRDLSGRPF